MSPFFFALASTPPDHCAVLPDRGAIVQLHHHCNGTVSTYTWRRPAGATMPRGAAMGSVSNSWTTSRSSSPWSSAGMLTCPLPDDHALSVGGALREGNGQRQVGPADSLIRDRREAALNHDHDLACGRRDGVAQCALRCVGHTAHGDVVDAGCTCITDNGQGPDWAPSAPGRPGQPATGAAPCRSGSRDRPAPAGSWAGSGPAPGG